MLPDLDVGDNFEWVCRLVWHFKKAQVQGVIVGMSAIRENFYLILLSVNIAVSAQEGKWDTFKE